jgi:hypothetical protein
MADTQAGVLHKMQARGVCPTCPRQLSCPGPQQRHFRAAGSRRARLCVRPVLPCCLRKEDGLGVRPPAPTCCLLRLCERASAGGAWEELPTGRSRASSPAAR